MAAVKKPAKVTFKQDWNVGSASAEQDDAFLESCFVDTGLLPQLVDTSCNKSVVLGRVGAGKSALLKEVLRRNPNNSIQIDPQEFSLRYISSSNTLQFVSELGVKLDPVFQALWKHVLCVELIRLRYQVFTSSDSANFWGRLLSGVTFNESKRKALEYFSQFGGTDFWQATEVRVREITRRIEEGIENSIGGKAKILDLSQKGSTKLTSEEKDQITSNVKRFLDSIHMSSLQQVIGMLAEEEFAKKDRRYYVVIDDLDTQWADDDLRYRLIRALIEVIKRFRSIRSVKIIVALRTDLLSTVLDATRDSGFQEEKFEDFFLRVRWSDTQLKDMIGARINELVRHKYSRTKTVAFYDIFPRQVRKLDTLTYVLKRTMRRPRDLIMFVNQCFHEASGRTEITPSIIQNAEIPYSTGRSKSLQQEWHDIYPQLGVHLEFLKHLRSRTVVKEIAPAHINGSVLALAEFDDKTGDPVSLAGLAIFRSGNEITNPGQALAYLRTLIAALFRVGAVGIKRPPSGRFTWNDEASAPTLAEVLDLDTVIAIHPMLYGALGTYVLPDSE